MKTRIIKRKGTLLSSVAMLSTAMLLTACGGDGGDSPVDDGGANPGESGAQALLYAYPDNGQNEISTAAPVVLRFSSAVNLGEAQNSITVYEGDAQSGTMVAVTPESVAGEPNNVLLQPDEDLKPNQTYTVVIEDLRLRKGTAKDQTLTFTTRPLHEGPKNLVVKDDAFEVSRRMPDGSAMEPVMDFSSFRFQFTQPIDRATANYGEDPASTGPGGGTIPADSVVLRDSSGAPVPATLLVDGAYMTVDPDAEYLNAGETYTLDITAGLTSTYGETLGAQSYTLTPKDSSPKGEPAILVQKLTQGSTSRLTGKPVNEVPVNGTLLGENKNITQASAEVVRAELADVTTYTDVTPIRLPKGTVLNGAEINPILIGGEVPAGFGSGDVTMTVLSDASGYLVPNPYAENNPDALRIVHLLMDVGIATSEPRANGAFTQDLLHIELVGLAEVDPTAGVLNLDAVSVVEPNILGQEYGYGMLSFQLQSYKDQNNPPERLVDNTPPTLQSWVPGQNADKQRPGDPLILNFSETISKKIPASSVRLYQNGAEMPIDYSVDGASLIIKPKQALAYDKETNPVAYQIQVDGAGIKDLAGNTASNIILDEFSLPEQVEQRQPTFFGNPTGPFEPVEQRSPIVLAMNPGFPCALEPSTRNLASDDAGRCLGGFPGWDQGTEYDIKSEDDHIRISKVSKDQPIVVVISKNVDPASVTLGQTFLVEKIDNNGAVIQSIAGELDIKPRIITFFPLEPWEEDALYRYTLKSTVGSVAPLCNGTDAICDEIGLPLQTRVLGDLTIEPVDAPDSTSLFPPEREYKFLKSPVAATSGGPDLEQFFRGGVQSKNVMQVLYNAPVSDANANFINERNEDIGDLVLALPILQPYGYAMEEFGAEGQPLDSSADPVLDPMGVVPPPNSAKVLSRDTKGLPPGENPVLNGVNVGCGYQSTQPYDPNNPSEVFGVPLECPEQKFTYLNGALTAQVTDNYVDGEGLEVKIWPSQFMATAIYVRQHLQTLSSFLYASSGAQLLRMRYEEDDQGNRTKPITGWIRQSENGPILTASVDVYMDGLELSQVGLQFNDPTHTLNSYTFRMDLSGPVKFLDDGRMLVQQFNTNPVDIDVRVQVPDGSWGGSLLLRIPEGGNHLQYVSETIK